jgi:hypothetical protein
MEMSETGIGGGMLTRTCTASMLRQHCHFIFCSSFKKYSLQFFDGKPKVG